MAGMACNPVAVRRVAQRMPEPETLGAVAELFKALADPTRATILQALVLGELCVHDLAALVRMTQSAVSHQLRLLRLARLVRCRRQGKMTYYALADDHVRVLIATGIEHVEEAQRKDE